MAISFLATIFSLASTSWSTGEKKLDINVRGEVAKVNTSPILSGLTSGIFGKHTELDHFT